VSERLPASDAPAVQDETQLEPVLDLAHLRAFTDGDPQLEGELLTLFLSTAEVYLAAMASALQTEQSWRSPVHALKGASGNLGARRVMQLAQAAERLPPCATTLAAVRQAVEEVRGFAQSRSGRATPDGQPPSRIC
jgi:HPt (histidine-containing phosphotransfer) domain-containing protein